MGRLARRLLDLGSKTLVVSRLTGGVNTFSATDTLDLLDGQQYWLVATEIRWPRLPIPTQIPHKTASLCGCSQCETPRRDTSAVSADPSARFISDPCSLLRGWEPSAVIV